MQGIAKIISSQSAIVAIVVIAAATVLAALGRITYADWKDLTLWVTVTYVGGEKVRDAAAAFREGSKKDTPAAAAPTSLGV